MMKTIHDVFSGKTGYVALAVLLSLATGWLGAAVQADGLLLWYPTLHKSPWTPPGWVFAWVWTGLYIMMGLSFGLVLAQKKALRQWPSVFFIVQLGLNVLWCYLFFAERNPLGALVCLVVLLGVVAGYTVMVWPIQRISAILFWPYILWLLFAMYLNAYIGWYNGIYGV